MSPIASKGPHEECWEAFKSEGSRNSNSSYLMGSLEELRLNLLRLKGVLRNIGLAIKFAQVFP